MFLYYPSWRCGMNWLVVWTPLKNISQLGWLFPIYGKIKNVPNHQPVKILEAWNFKKKWESISGYGPLEPVEWEIFQQLEKWSLHRSAQLPVNVHPSSHTAKSCINQGDATWSQKWWAKKCWELPKVKRNRCSHIIILHLSLALELISTSTYSSMDLARSSSAQQWDHTKDPEEVSAGTESNIWLLNK